MGSVVQSVTSSQRERASASAERHRQATARRRQRLDRDQERGASAETIAAHREALARLERLREQALTRVDELDLDARFAGEKAAANECQRVELLKAATCVANFAAGLRMAREKAEGSRTREQRRRDRQQHRQPLTARDRSIEVGSKLVEDPYRLHKPYAVPVNRKVDVLEEERANKRITTSQYEVGRIVQAIFEKASGARLGGGGFEASASRDRTIAHELAIIYRIDDAQVLKRYFERVERAIGSVGARFLRQVLADGQTLRQYAEARGKSGERGLAQVGGHFRLLLEGLDDAWAARGRAVLDEADKHDRRAAAIADRLAEPHRRVYATPGPRGGEETDERGVVTPAGRGYRWGRTPTA